MSVAACCSLHHCSHLIIYMDCRRYASEKAKLVAAPAAASLGVPSAVLLNFSTAFLPEAEDTVQT